MADTIDDLIQRLEAATEPSRELDRMICLHIGWTLKKMKGDARPYFRKPGVTEYYMRSEPPAFTASIDAATYLAGPGFWEVSGPRRYLEIPTSVPNHWRANFTPFDERNITVCGWGATEALARCSAALRARRATEAQR